MSNFEIDNICWEITNMYDVLTRRQDSEKKLIIEQFKKLKDEKYYLSYSIHIGKYTSHTDSLQESLISVHQQLKDAISVTLKEVEARAHELRLTLPTKLKLVHSKSE